MASRSSRRVVTDETEDQDLSKIEFETSEDVKVIPTFDALNLREDLLRGIYAYGKFCEILQCFRKEIQTRESLCQENFSAEK